MQAAPGWKITTRALFSTDYWSAYRALSMAEKRAIFILRRRFSLGFSKCR
jgi:hypothetical protein